MDNMEKNYLKYTCIWALIILAGLLLMYFLPAFTVGEHVMRRVDLLGDVRTQKILRKNRTVCFRLRRR